MSGAVTAKVQDQDRRSEASHPAEFREKTSQGYMSLKLRPKNSLGLCSGRVAVGVFSIQISSAALKKRVSSSGRGCAPSNASYFVAKSRASDGGYFFTLPGFSWSLPRYTTHQGEVECRAAWGRGNGTLVVYSVQVSRMTIVKFY